MTRLVTILVTLMAGLAGCAKPPADLLVEAHKAALTVSQEEGSALFDDSFTQVFPEEGLVCGSRINRRGASSESTSYERYYFSRTKGVAIEGETPSWLPLANACIVAIEERLAAADRRLATEHRGT